MDPVGPDLIESFLFVPSCLSSFLSVNLSQYHNQAWLVVVGFRCCFAHFLTLFDEWLVSNLKKLILTDSFLAALFKPKNPILSPAFIYDS